MTIREATFDDIPDIIPVLKASLGTQDLPLSEEIWKFKHINNPFGKSLVLLAIEDDEIVGVRAFMKWELTLKDKVFKCYRAVDTATHPNHRGKGIFKKLTLKAVEMAKENNDNFVFNFPNEKSRPGYLKMGWQKAGNIKVALKPSFRSFWKFYKNEKHEVHNKVSAEALDALCQKWNKKVQQKGLYTSKSPEYLHWRFENNPLQEYSVEASDGFYLAVSTKKRKKIKELRVTECIFNDKKGRKKARKAIRKLSSKFGAQVISFSPELLSFGMFSVKGAFGPILTVRELNLSTSEKATCFDMKNWSYSLGDLELF